ncbi:bifunctional 5,10-methylenetetrahydrofolate dehydrogenase/5,10-methenyltetrahydrofolate cyclohydrolase [Aerococcaceae bacterium DSM 111020]|nr:bifunctional 5,10-methylenetetrahydrofolate dehydrogenase/5,10-methenyltetrahydrofolate cyclohydrolase [Aerococcaceae bacterium DSM 111020]
MKIIDGRKRSNERMTQYKKAIELLRTKDVHPKLVVVTVGDDPASKVYVGQKQKRAQQLEMSFEWVVLEGDVSQEELIAEIDKRNADPEVSGLIVQLPLPDHLDEQAIIQAIAPEKDVDGFHPYNIGQLVKNEAKLVPCTPKGIMDLLEANAIQIAGRNVVIIGRSQIVGLPLALMMTHANATVSVIHSQTANPNALIAHADIIVTAAGNPDAIDESAIPEEAVIIDVSILRGEDGKLHGDVDAEKVQDKVAAMTPVPGGVGPMTVAMLMEQTILCACHQNDIDPDTILGEI